MEHGTLWEITTLCFIHEPGQIILLVTRTYAVPGELWEEKKDRFLVTCTSLTRSGENGCFLSSYMSPCNATEHIPPVTRRLCFMSRYAFMDPRGMFMNYPPLVLLAKIIRVIPGQAAAISARAQRSHDEAEVLGEWGCLVIRSEFNIKEKAKQQTEKVSPRRFNCLEIGRECAELPDPLFSSLLSSSASSLCMEKIKEPNTPGNMSGFSLQTRSARKRAAWPRNCSIARRLALHCPHVYILGEFKALIKRGSAWDEMEAEIAEPWLPGSSSRLSTGRKGARTKAISNYTSRVFYLQTLHQCFRLSKARRVLRGTR